MEIRAVDFGILTKNFTGYIDGKKNISDIRNTFIEKIQPVRKEMESIIAAANSGIIMDESTQKIRYDKFQKLQEEAIAYDNEFKETMSKMNDELNKKTFKELSDIINEWGKNNSIDLIMGKMEVVYLDDKYDATNDILSILKEKNMFVDLEIEKESV